VLAAMLLTACGTVIQPGSDAAPETTQDTDVPMATDFAVSVYDGGRIAAGQKVSFAEFLGQGKPVVLNMWAGLCPPCRLEMPDFQKVSEQFGDEIVMFGLDLGPLTNLGTSDDGQALIQELGITYPTGTTTDADVVKKYQLIGMPTTYFVTAEGRIMRQWTGLLTKDKLAELVQELISASES
jgi:thiol-disulfide isomerase/thioredoxin